MMITSTTIKKRMKSIPKIETEFLAEFVTLLLDVSCLRGWTEVPRKPQKLYATPQSGILLYY